MRNLILAALLCASLSAQAGGFTDSDGSLTDHVNQTGTLNLNSADWFAVCKFIDLTTTKIAFNSGAVEGNPMMGAVYAKWRFAGMVGVSALLIYGIYKLHQHYGKQADLGIAIAAGLTCGVAGHNLTVN